MERKGKVRKRRKKSKEELIVKPEKKIKEKYNSVGLYRVVERGFPIKRHYLVLIDCSI